MGFDAPKQSGPAPWGVSLMPFDATRAAEALARLSESAALDCAGERASSEEYDKQGYHSAVRGLLDRLRALAADVRPKDPVEFLGRMLDIARGRAGRTEQRLGARVPSPGLSSDTLNIGIGCFVSASSARRRRDLDAGTLQRSSSDPVVAMRKVASFDDLPSEAASPSSELPNGNGESIRMVSFSNNQEIDTTRTSGLPLRSTDRLGLGGFQREVSFVKNPENIGLAESRDGKAGPQYSGVKDDASGISKGIGKGKGIGVAPPKNSILPERKNVPRKKRPTISTRHSPVLSAKLDSGIHIPSMGQLSRPALLKQATENFSVKAYVGCDIGGTLCKITFFEPFDCDREDIKRRSAFLKSATTYGSTGIRDPRLQIECFGGRFHFLSFQTSHLDGAVRIMKRQSLHTEFVDKVVPITGGGAYKYEQFFLDRLRTYVWKVDELTCLLTGLNFALKHVPDECFYLEHHKRRTRRRGAEGDRKIWEKAEWKPAKRGIGAKTDELEPLPVRRTQSMAGVFPYLLVNIGSGVSILRVDSETEFKRVGGSCIGGGTYWGLCRLLTGVKGFKDAMAYAADGDHHNVDMTVGDIYGGDYTRFNLKASTVASAFGKLAMKDDLAVTKADAAASLLHMIGANIAQLAYWCAREQNIPKILFAGNFLRQNMSSAVYISSSINYWSQGKMKALFLRHEGYFGSLGAMLMSKDSPSAPNTPCDAKEPTFSDDDRSA